MHHSNSLSSPIYLPPSTTLTLHHPHITLSHHPGLRRKFGSTNRTPIPLIAQRIPLFTLPETTRGTSASHVAQACRRVAYACSAEQNRYRPGATALVRRPARDGVTSMAGGGLGLDGWCGAVRLWSWTLLGKCCEALGVEGGVYIER